MSSYTTKKPFCKVCQDAGKSELEYSNHWVKDRTGKTTCPTLLNTTCRNCQKLGHTSKFCSKPVAAIVVQKARVVPLPLEQPKGNKQSNLFTKLFSNDSDSEEEDKKMTFVGKKLSSAKKVDIGTKKTEFPSLSTRNPLSIVQPKSGWAAIAAKPKPETPPPVAQQDHIMLADFIKKTPLKKKQSSSAIPAPWAKSNAPIVHSRRWADDEDDEDDDEEPTYKVGCETIERWNVPDEEEDEEDCAW
jgi:hypothetical protein